MTSTLTPELSFGFVFVCFCHAFCFVRFWEGRNVHGHVLQILVLSNKNRKLIYKRSGLLITTWHAWQPREYQNKCANNVRRLLANTFQNVSVWLPMLTMANSSINSIQRMHRRIFPWFSVNACFWGSVFKSMVLASGFPPRSLTRTDTIWRNSTTASLAFTWWWAVRRWHSVSNCRWNDYRDRKTFPRVLQCRDMSNTASRKPLYLGTLVLIAK